VSWFFTYIARTIYTSTLTLTTHFTSQAHFCNPKAKPTVLRRQASFPRTSNTQHLLRQRDCDQATNSSTASSMTTSDTANERSASAFPFEKLPAELKKRIIQLAIPQGLSSRFKIRQWNFVTSKLEWSIWVQKTGSVEAWHDLNSMIHG
jgi:hypothetical protein